MGHTDTITRQLLYRLQSNCNLKSDCKLKVIAYSWSWCFENLVWIENTFWFWFDIVCIWFLFCFDIYDSHVQLKSDQTTWSSSKPYVNEIILKGQNPALKRWQQIKLLIYIHRGFRAFHTGNIGSVVQRAAKLLSVKLWEWFRPGQSQTLANWFDKGQGQAAVFL